ncbi:hypothetical protein Cni_G01836 [Canna indica]|uniref:Reverse transcriptase domain-containing protein n=1 Tax=Canna indica TaxID=4628 RepID=A0AAQ3PZ87_9LILI|nr:hypothetical protein Cni_G01836 [Canna indica]
MRDLESIFKKNKMPKGWNDTMLIFIPKKKKARKIPEFRPIALCNVIYKVAAKIIVNRMRGVIQKVINKEQSAFTPNRNIHDNILVVSEMINTFNKSKSKKPSVILKLDLEKAYDRIEWSIVYKVMGLMKFPRELINWVKCCIEEISFECKMNGETSDQFRSHKGLRQGDPLSPYLFIIMEETLTTITRKAVEMGMIIPFKMKELKEKLEVMKPEMNGGKDLWVWTGNESGKISVKSVYWFIKGREELEVGPDINWRVIWNMKETVLQSDATWAQNLKAGFGFVIKKQDEYKFAGFNNGKAQNPLHAKAQAIWFGLDNCKKKGIDMSNLTVKSL